MKFSVWLFWVVLCPRFSLPFKAVGQVGAERVQLLVHIGEPAQSAHHLDKPPNKAVSEKLHKGPPHPFLFHAEPLRRFTPPARLEREDEHVRAVEQLL